MSHKPGTAGEDKGIMSLSCSVVKQNSESIQNVGETAGVYFQIVIKSTDKQNISHMQLMQRDLMCAVSPMSTPGISPCCGYNSLPDAVHICLQANVYESENINNC